jgi:hypothetical protein
MNYLKDGKISVKCNIFDESLKFESRQEKCSFLEFLVNKITKHKCAFILPELL